MDPTNFEEFNRQLQNSILNPTKHAFALPTDIAFHRSVDRDFAKEIDACSAKVLKIANKLLSVTNGTKGKGRVLEVEDDVIDNFHSVVVDAMDQLLERTDICLDDFLGRSKAPVIALNPQPIKKVRPSASQGRLDPALQHASHLQKPQLKFKKKPDNDRNSVWQPSLKHKYNAQVPLGYNFQDGSENIPSYSIPHPYRYEIIKTIYPERMFESHLPIHPRSFDETPLHWISTPSEFQTMLQKLCEANEIAVDLEHHNYRSFNGFVCLMQISTRTEDFIVDTLVLREELEELNEAFTNPNITKVFHGAESDIIWLQQNFNIYVVNLFDTFHASKVLDFPRHGLASLLEMYCDFTPDKRFQLADWRIRPLPQEMLTYARSDTHFLLYIYDNLRNALLDRAESRSQSPQPSASTSTFSPRIPAQSFLHEVLSRSRDTALRLYEQDGYDSRGGSGSGGWDNLAKKWGKAVLTANADDGLAKGVYKCVHEWRDMVARIEDESTRYVLPNHYLFQLVERPPADVPAFLNMFSNFVSPIIKKRVKELVDEISEVVKKYLGTQDKKTEAQHVELSVEKNQESTELTSGDSSVWSNTSLIPITAPSSTLFGPSSIQKLPHQAYVTSTSLLFGSQSSRPLQIRDDEKNRFQEIQSRIHSRLVITPSIPTVAVDPPIDVPTPDTAPTTKYDEQQIEVPFVPARQRQTRPSQVEFNEVDDSIIVVGQRQKKRKRTKVKSTAGDGEAVEAFDYATAENILDVNPRAEGARGAARKKQRGTGGAFFGNFPAPPKASSAPKAGNISHTFK